jgi:hypothetical protein
LLEFKNLICPPEGGEITGHTVDGNTVKGTIKSDRKLNFTIEAANVEAKLYFKGFLNKDKISIRGNYGF